MTGQFEVLKPSFNEMKQLIDDIGAQLDGTANAIEQLDQNIAQMLQVSPGGGRHGELPYVKISTTSQDVGKIKIVNGTEDLYKASGEKNVTLIFIGGK